MVSVTDYGVFVELEKGIEGLVHISEMSWSRHVKHPSKIVAIGDEVEALVLTLDKRKETNFSRYETNRAQSMGSN